MTSIAPDPEEVEGLPQVGLFEHLGRAECLDLLARERFGRVVLSVDCMPVAFPVNLVVIGDDVYFMSAHGAKVDQAGGNSVVSIEADATDPIYHTGWSVLVTGMAEIVTDNELAERVERELSPWAPLDHPVVVRVPCTVVTGRRLTRRPPHRALT